MVNYAEYCKNNKKYFNNNYFSNKIQLSCNLLIYIGVRKMKKFLKVLLMLLVMSMVFLPSVGASTLSDEEMKLEKQKNYLSSVENYINYLEDQKANGNELAEEGLNQFLSLDAKEKKVFIKALKSTEKLSNALTGNEMSLTTTIDDIEVPITTEETFTDEVPTMSEEITDGVIVNAASGSLTVTASESLYVFSIKVSTIYSSTTFNHNGSSATSIISGDHWHSNINPAMLFTKEQAASQNYLSSGRAYHRGNWTVYATGSLGFINDSVRFWVSANATSRSKQLSSTHPNMTGYSWKSF